MNRHKYLLGILFIAFIFGAAVFSTAAQPDENNDEVSAECQVNFVDIIDEVEQVCTGVGRDQVCYGNLNVNAIPRQNNIRLNFDQPGDSTSVSLIRSLYLSALNQTDDTWGIAQMNLLANLSQQSPQDVMLLLFGDVQVESSTVDRVSLDLAVSPDYAARIRNTPGLNSLVIDVADPNEIVHAVGRLADNSWIRIQEDQVGRVGWVSTQLLQTNGVDIESLPVDDGDSPYFGAMQAIYFQNGTTPSCGNTISDGLIIQTPEGVARLSLLINEVTIELLGSDYGATAFVEASPEDGMSISVLRGGVNVTANDSTVYVDNNKTVNIPLSDNLTPLASSSQPSASDATLSENLVMMDYINRLFPILSVADGDDGTVGDGDTGSGGETCTSDDWRCGPANRGCTNDLGTPVPGNACLAPGQSNGQANSQPAGGGQGQGQGQGQGKNNKP